MSTSIILSGNTILRDVNARICGFKVDHQLAKPLLNAAVYDLIYGTETLADTVATNPEIRHPADAVIVAGVTETVICQHLEQYDIRPDDRSGLWRFSFLGSGRALDIQLSKEEK